MLSDLKNTGRRKGVTLVFYIFILDYTRRAGWPEEPMFWIANTGFLFVNCQILDPRIKKIQKTLLFWNIFWSPNTGFLFVKRPNFGSKTGSRSLSKNHICEAILTKTGEMSFYLKQLWDTYEQRTTNNNEHLTNIKKLRLLHNRPFGQKCWFTV